MPGRSGKRESSKSGDGLQLGQPRDIMTDLDPALQRVIAQVREGRQVEKALVAREEDGAISVDVLAELVDATKPVDGLNVVRVIGPIATGTVRVDLIESVRSNPNVRRLKLARKLTRQLGFSVKEINAHKTKLATAFPDVASGIDGAGVIVGVVDYGCDFVHPNFRNADGSTRILFLWDQAAGELPSSPPEYGYGRELDADALNAALGAADPYFAARYEVEPESHGTHVLDIAAGNGRATGRSGVAPGADIIFVNIAGDSLESTESFGNSRRLLEAVDYIFMRAEQLGRPAVVNLSLGTHGGPHDGTTPAEIGMDALLEQPNRAITVSAGNSFERRSHASGDIAAQGQRTLGWEILAGDMSPNEVEVWYAGGGALQLTLVTPSGQRLGPVSPGASVPIVGGGQEVGEIIHRVNDSGNGDNQINIILSPVLPSGTWGIELRNGGASPVHFDAFVERDNNSMEQPFNQSRFVTSDADTALTIGSISCGNRTIAVGSYLSGLPVAEISPFSAAGPTRDGRQKPEISAPGQHLHPFHTQGILAANATTQGAVRMSGTSMASPHVAGVIALIMQAAGRSLTSDEIRAALIDTARRQPPSGQDWDARFGFGRIDATAGLHQVLGTPTPPIDAAQPDRPVSETMADQGALQALVASLSQLVGGVGAKVSINIDVEPTRP